MKTITEVLPDSSPGWLTPDRPACRTTDDQRRVDEEVGGPHFACSRRQHLDERIDDLASLVGIDAGLARRVVSERLAQAIADTVVGEWRQLFGTDLGTSALSSDRSVSSPTDDPRVSTPFLNVEEAARYLRKTPKAIYGLIERGRLRKLPGSHVCYFTKEMLDDFLRGENHVRCLRAVRRQKG